MATIAELQTKLTLDDGGFKKGIENAHKSVQGFANKAKIGLGAAAAVIAGGLVTAFYTLSSVMDQAQKRVSDLVDTATRLGAGIPELQRLQYAAQQSGISIGSLNKALGIMEKNLGNAARAGDSATDAFGRIGLSATALAAMGVDQQYLAISEAIKKIPTASGQAAAAMAVFGRAGIEQLSLIKDNVGGLIDEFKGLGIELTTDQAKSLEAYGDSVSKLDAVWTGFKDQLAAALAGPLKHVLDWIVQSSINMGGLGAAARSVADFILGATNGLVGFFGGLYKGIQASIIAAEELLVVLLRLSQIGTLGLSNINLPGGLGGAGDKIASLKKDINERSASYMGAQNTQQKIQVEIRAASGFVAEVVNSSENTTKINNTVSNSITDAARGEIR